MGCWLGEAKGEVLWGYGKDMAEVLSFGNVNSSPGLEAPVTRARFVDQVVYSSRDNCTARQGDETRETDFLSKFHK